MKKTNNRDDKRKRLKGIRIKGFKVNSIKSKLLVYFTMLVLVSFVIVGIISVTISKNALIETAEDSVLLMANQSSMLVKSRMDNQRRTLEMIVANDGIRTMDWETQQPVLQRQLSETNFLDLAIVGFDGIAHYIDGETSDLGEREYIKNALAGETNVSDMIVSNVTGDLVMMYGCTYRMGR